MISQPLDDEAYNRLEEFLISEQTPAMTMPLDMLEGFLTAVASSPYEIKPSEWLPYVWGLDEEPKYESDEEAEEIAGLLMNFYYEIVDHLETDDIYMPLWTDLDGEDIDLSCHIWCLGYTKGMELDLESWASIKEDSEIYTYLVPILLSAMDPENPPTEFEDIITDPKQRQILREGVPESICVLYDHWIEDSVYYNPDIDINNPNPA